MLGNLKGAVRKGRGEKEKEWTDCVQSDILALEAEVWILTVMEVGRRLTRLDIAKNRERHRDWKVVIVHGRVEAAKRHQFA